MLLIKDLLAKYVEVLQLEIKKYLSFPIWVLSGIEKVVFGRARVYPNFEKSGSSMSGIEQSQVRAGIFGFGYTRTHH